MKNEDSQYVFLRFFIYTKNGILHYIRKMSCKTAEFVKENGEILVNRYIYYKKVTILL